MSEVELQQMKERLEDHEKRLRKLEALFREEGDSAFKEKPMSIGEFIAETNPKSDNQKTLVIGYFLENMKGKASFTRKDIEAAFREAKEQVPTNINLCVLRNIQQTFMMESGKEGKLKRWTLTRTGVEFIEKKLKKE